MEDRNVRWIVVRIERTFGPVEYGSDFRRLNSLSAAISHGLKSLGHDNFVIAAIKEDRIIEVSYMGRPWYDRYRQAVIDQLRAPLRAA